jgi:sugar phosphate isomerase/epimerase
MDDILASLPGIPASNTTCLQQGMPSPMTTRVCRREMIARSGLCLGTAAVASLAPAATPAGEPERSPREPFGYSLNTGTLLGQKLPLAEVFDVAAKAGYRAIEPWIEEIKRHADAGGSLADLKKRAADRGLTVIDAIGFFDWIGDDEAKRKAGLEQMRRDMDLVAQIGGLRIAAPPLGGYNSPVELRRIADRYRKVLEIGRQIGIVPQLELWGGSKTLSRVSEVAFVTIEAADPDACALFDVFHVYKGGSDFASLRLLNGAALHVLHVNDYPAQPPRATVTDAHRVYPGDGVAPLGLILRTLAANGFRGYLSLELFNRAYWAQNALEVARTGLEKTRAAVTKALG